MSPRAALLAGVVLALGGCGYAPIRRAPGRTQYRVLAVDNRTALAEAGPLLAEAGRDALARTGALAEQGGVPLRLTLLSLKSLPSALGGATATAYRLEAKVRVEDQPQGGPAQVQELVLGEDYLAGEDVLGTEANRRAALRRLARAIGQEIAERLEADARLGTP